MGYHESKYFLIVQMIIYHWICICLVVCRHVIYLLVGVVWFTLSFFRAPKTTHPLIKIEHLDLKYLMKGMCRFVRHCLLA